MRRAGGRAAGTSHPGQPPPSPPTTPASSSATGTASTGSSVHSWAISAPSTAACPRPASPGISRSAPLSISRSAIRRPWATAASTSSAVRRVRRSRLGMPTSDDELRVRRVAGGDVMLDESRTPPVRQFGQQQPGRAGQVRPVVRAVVVAGDEDHGRSAEFAERRAGRRASPRQRRPGRRPGPGPRWEPAAGSTVANGGSSGTVVAPSPASRTPTVLAYPTVSRRPACGSRAR